MIAFAVPSSTISIAVRSSTSLFPHHHGLQTRTRPLVQVTSSRPRSPFSMPHRLTELISCNAGSLYARSLSSPYLDASLSHSNARVCACRVVSCVLMSSRSVGCHAVGHTRASVCVSNVSMRCDPTTYIFTSNMFLLPSCMREKNR